MSNTAEPTATPKGPNKRRRGKKNVDTTTRPEKPQDEPSSPTEDVSAAVPVEIPEKELLKELSKRLKKSTKKLESIQKSEDKIKDLDDNEKENTLLINKDERKKIADKPITQAIHKELQEVFDKLKEDVEYEENRLKEQIKRQIKRQKAEHEAQLEASVHDAREEGLQQGKNEVAGEANNKFLSLIKFLRLAGYRRTTKSDQPEEDQAIEEVLILVYSGDNAAVTACTKLAAGSSDFVCESDTGVTYARIRELAYALDVPEENVPDQETTVEQAPEVPDDVVEHPETDTSKEAPQVTEQAQQPIDTPQQTVNGVQTTAEEPLTVLPTAVTDELASNENGKDTHFAAAANNASSARVQPVLQELGDIVDNRNADVEVQGREARRGGRGRGRGYRGGRGNRGGPRGEHGEHKHDGEHRGGEPRRGSGEHRGEKRRGSGEHRRGSGEHRGEKGEQHGEGGENRGENQQGEYRGGHRGRGKGRRGGDRGGKGEQIKTPQVQTVPTSA